MSIIVENHKYYLHIYETYLVLIDQEDQKRRCKFLKTLYFYKPIAELIHEFERSMEYLNEK